jgi:mannitol/fructose-specific phosphotransferase system IIA component (Ntr-type)
MMESEQAMSNGTLKVKKELMQRIARYAEAAGYSSAQEFVEHVLERELATLEDSQSDQEILNKLKGLGYID